MRVDLGQRILSQVGNLAAAALWQSWLGAADEGERGAAEALVVEDDPDLLAAAATGWLAPLGGVLRAAAGPGPARLNRVTLAAAADAHAAQLGAVGRVVVGWDERRFAALGGATSHDLALAAAAAYEAAGVAVVLAPEEPGRALAEPELAAAVRREGADGGLYVGAGTAPAGEGGATFFGPDGAPRAIPAPTGPARRATPRASGPAPRQSLADPGREAWYAATLALARAPETRSLHVVFTPLGGVAGAAVGGVLARAGFRVTTVRAEAVQDGAFAAVPLHRPEPRRPAALAAALALAREVEADLVLAVDGAGACLGAAFPDPVLGFRPLAEDEIAALVADHLLQPDGGRVFTTVATSPLVARIAAVAGAALVTDLDPGFAALGAALRAAPEGSPAAPAAPAGAPAEPGPFLAVGAGGALTARADLPTADAAAAALLLAERAAVEKAAGRTLGDALRALWRRHGYVGTRRRAVGFESPDGPTRMAALVAGLRREPPERIADRAVTAVSDRSADGALVYDLEGDARVVVTTDGPPAAIEVHVSVAGAPVDPAADELKLARALGETDGQAAALVEDFVLQALARADLPLPRAAFAVPDTVGVDLVAHFFAELVPRLEVGAQEIRAGYATEAEVRGWVREALGGYGPDAAALLRPGLDAHLSGLRAVAGERGRATLDLIRGLFD